MIIFILSGYRVNANLISCYHHDHETGSTIIKMNSGMSFCVQETLEQIDRLMHETFGYVKSV